jgi:hypothetical protein
VSIDRVLVIEVGEKDETEWAGGMMGAEVLQHLGADKNGFDWLFDFCGPSSGKNWTGNAIREMLKIYIQWTDMLGFTAWDSMFSTENLIAVTPL